MATRAQIRETVISSLVREETTETLLSSWFRRANQRIEQELRVAQMRKTATGLSPIGGQLSTPADFLAVATMRLVTSAGRTLGPLIYASPAAYETRQSQPDLTGRVPGYYTMDGKVVRVTPWTSATSNIDLTYFAKLPTLGPDDDSSTWVTTDYEDLFTNATLIYGHRHYFEDDRGLLKEGLVTAECQRLNASYLAEKVGDGPLIMSPGRRLGGRHS